MDSSGELNVSLIIKSPCGRVHGRLCNDNQ